MIQNPSPEVVTSSPSVSLALDSPELASTYDRVSVRQFTHGKVLIAQLGLARGERVLDVGCGTGQLGGYVADLVAPDGEVIGVDPLPLRIELARTKHPRFRPTVGRAEDLSALAPSTFDAAYANSVLHWVFDKPRALREALRVLKPGGRIAVNSADAQRAHQLANLVREAVLEERLEDVAAAGAFGTNHRVSGAELDRLLTDAGFVDVRVTHHTFVDQLTGVEDAFAWSKSSSFGNFLSDLGPSDFERVRSRIADKLESHRSPNGIVLERYLIFATARKP